MLRLCFLLFLLSTCSSPIEKKSGDLNKKRVKRKKAKKVIFKPRRFSRHFKESAKDLGLEKTSAVRTYAVDFNHDGLTDLVLLPDHYSAPKFYQFDPKIKKYKLLKKSLFDKSLRASFLLFADFNKDGAKDVIVATLNQKTELNKYPLRLFLYDKKSYKEVLNAIPKRKTPAASVSLVDMNMDGLLDIYVANWYDMTKKGRKRLTPDRLYIASGNGLTFRDVSKALQGEYEASGDGSYVRASPSFGSSVCDLDQNGFPDILVASSSGYDNKVWFNLKRPRSNDRQFKNLARESGLAADKEGQFSRLSGGNSFYMNCSDYNDDGLIDVATGELFHSYDNESKDRSSILTGKSRSFPPQFIRTEYHKDDGSGSWSQGDRRSLWVDLDHDSLQDLIVENSGFPPKSKLIYFKQSSDRSFTDLSYDYNLDLINPTGTIKLDANRDGLIDLLTATSNTRRSSLEKRIFLYLGNKRSNQTRTIKVVLKGKLSNAHGLGASVFLRTSNRRVFRNVDYAFGALPSQNEEGLWFTLTSDEAPLWFDVRWPYLVKKKGKAYPLQKRYRFSLKWLKKKSISLELFDNGKVKVL